MEGGAFAGHDAGGILATVLEHQQRIVQQLIHGPSGDDPDDSAHVTLSLLSMPAENSIEHAASAVALARYS